MKKRNLWRAMIDCIMKEHDIFKIIVIYIKFLYKNVKIKSVDFKILVHNYKQMK